MGAYPGSHYTFYLPINLKPLVLLRTVTNMLFSPSNTPLHIKHKTIRPSTHNTQSTQVITPLSQTIDYSTYQHTTTQPNNQPPNNSEETKKSFRQPMEQYPYT